MKRGATAFVRGALGALVLCVAGVALAAAAIDPGGLELTAAHIAEEMEHYGIGPLPGRTSLEVPFEFEGRRGHNVIGYLPASDGGGSGWEATAILLGTQHDVVTVLLAAKMLAAVSLRHPVIVAFWSDTGQPRTGSRAFVEQSGLPAAALLACIQLDSVDPAPENRLQVLGAGSSPVWRGLVERANVPVGFDISIQDDPELPSDSFSFHQVGIPAISLGTAGHSDPAASSDEPKQLNMEETERVAQFAALLVRRLDGLDERPEYVKFEPHAAKPKLKKQSPYTGTIPDYTAEVEGLRLAGVMEGGPAEAAGLAEGDVVVEFAGKQISGIFDYRDALDAVEVGRPIQVVFTRDGERREVTLVPTVRP